MSAIGVVRRLTRGGNSTRLATVGVVLTLMAGCVGFVMGHGNSALTVNTPPGNAWLANDSRGSVTMVNGSTGRASAEVLLGGSSGHSLQVIQQGSTILVRDPITGLLTRIDPGQLSLGASVATPVGSLVVASSAASYLINLTADTFNAQRVDPVTLNPIGKAVDLTGSYGQPVVDESGTLWVPDPPAGTVIPITGSQQGTPVRVAGDGSDIILTTAGGEPIAVDTSQRRITAISPDGSENVVTLPASADSQTLPLLVPATSPSGSLPVLSPGNAPDLVLVDLASATTRTIPLGTNVSGDSLGAPVQAGSRVFIPDFTTGTALVYDASSGLPATEITVTGKAGQFDTQVVDGIVYFNDPTGTDAVVVTPDGQVHQVAKSGPGVPTNSGTQAPTNPPVANPPANAAPVHQNQGAGSNPGNHGNGNQGNNQGNNQPNPPQPPPANPAPPANAAGPPPQAPVNSNPVPPPPAPVNASPALPSLPVQVPSVLPPPPSTAPPVAVIPPPSSAPPPSQPSQTSAPPSAPPPSTHTPPPSSAPPSTPPSSAPPTTAPPTTHSATPTPTPTAPPLAPTGVRTANGAGYIDVSWNQATSGGPVDSYKVTTSPSGGTQTSTGSTSVRITGLDCTTIYSVTVTAVGPGGSVASAPINTRQCTAPSAPQGVSVSHSGADSLVVSWSAPSNNGGDGSVSYKVQGPKGTTTTTSTSYTESGLTPGHDYSFTVTAVNGAGSTAASAVSAIAGGTGSGTINLVYFTTSQPPCNPPIGSCTAGIHSTTSYSTSPIVWNAQDNTTFTLFCQAQGESLRNDKLTASTRWLYVRKSASGPYGWVSAMWISTDGSGGSGAPQCPSGL